jgi:hypothetical protein
MIQAPGCKCRIARVEPTLVDKVVSVAVGAKGVPRLHIAAFKLLSLNSLLSIPQKKCLLPDEHNTFLVIH